ncbi:MAG: cystathionine beta-synthase [Dehalococcoidales bacterium]|nr:cystathionine beta-synthase [Dehalococcoidales bacterium]
MVAFNNVLEAIGHTPLVKLNNITRNIKSSIYVKVEYVNPGGSIKDRVARAMIETAEKDGLLKPGGTIIEATAGNTGVGLALVAAVKKYRCIFVLPDKMSRDKIDLLKAYGAEVVITPTSVSPDSPESYNGVADRLAREIPGAFRPNQFTNPVNPLIHYLTTGPEIWEETEGEIDVLVAGMGTGGTISGSGKYLKEKNPDIQIVGADPEGSILSGDSPKSYKVEGIGEDFIPRTFDRQVVDEMIRVSDKESFNTARRLAREEGLLVGGSSGTAVAAALKYAQRLDKPKYIVVILPDTGRNYLTKIFSDSWMQEYGYWGEVQPQVIKVGDILSQKRGIPMVIKVEPQDILSKVVQVLHEYNISQVPVVIGDEVVGSLNEASLMKLLYDGVDLTKQEVSAVMGKPLPTIDEDVDVSEAYRLLLSGTIGLVVTRNKTLTGILTRSDLINYWAQWKREK